jgi:hypothetical protein
METGSQFSGRDTAISSAYCQATQSKHQGLLLKGVVVFLRDNASPIHILTAAERCCGVLA